MAGVWLTRSLRTNRISAAARHAARVDPAADDAGVTTADRTLPPDAKPTEVLAGIYIDRILELSVK